jgi:xyloglucan-specific exo-beta-1,4-glucanase
LQGVAYARTDIGGAYRLNADDDTWTAITDFASLDTWNYWGVDALATDPVETNRLYLVISPDSLLDPQVLISHDRLLGCTLMTGILIMAKSSFQKIMVTPSRL